MHVEQEQYLLLLRREGVECLAEQFAIGDLVAVAIGDRPVEHHVVADGDFSRVRAVETVSHRGEQVRTKGRVGPLGHRQLRDHAGEGLRDEILGIGDRRSDRSCVLECSADVVAIELGDGLLVTVTCAAEQYSI